MKNRLLGITLIEAMLYIGLFSVVILIVLNFMLSTQESTLRNNRRGSVYKSAEFIIQHINNSFDNAIYIDNTNSIFGTNMDTLQLQFSEGNKQYILTDSTLLFDSIPITPSNISVTQFTLEPIYDKDTDIVAVKILIEIVSTQDSSITDTINLLATLR